MIIVKLHRVLTSATGNPYLHGYYIFTRIKPETAKQSLHHSCMAALTTEGFRYLKTVKVTAAVNLSLYPKLTFQTFTFRHRAGVRQYTSYYYLALSCVFNKQSPLAIMCHFLFTKNLLKKYK